MPSHTASWLAALTLACEPAAHQQLIRTIILANKLLGSSPQQPLYKVSRSLSASQITWSGWTNKLQCTFQPFSGCCCWALRRLQASSSHHLLGGGGGKIKESIWIWTTQFRPAACWAPFLCSHHLAVPAFPHHFTPILAAAEFGSLFWLWAITSTIYSDLEADTTGCCESV